MNDTAAMTLVWVLVALVLTVGMYVWVALALQAVFRKAGDDGWKAWVPIVNGVTLLQRAGMSGWWILLTLVPVVSIVLYVVMIVACHRINRGFGHGAGMTVLAALLFPVWASVLGWGSSRWLADGPADAAGAVRSTDQFDAMFGRRALPWAFGEQPAASDAAGIQPSAPPVAPTPSWGAPADVAPIAVDDAQLRAAAGAAPTFAPSTQPEPAVGAAGFSQPAPAMTPARSPQPGRPEAFDAWPGTVGGAAVEPDPTLEPEILSEETDGVGLVWAGPSVPAGGHVNARPAFAPVPQEEEPALAEPACADGSAEPARADGSGEPVRADASGDLAAPTPAGATLTAPAPAPAAAAPAPVAPAPAPATWSRETPAPATPDLAARASAGPAPTVPAPETPAPAVPAPETPAPAAPAPAVRILAAPVDPALVAPAHPAAPRPFDADDPSNPWAPQAVQRTHDPVLERAAGRAAAGIDDALEETVIAVRRRPAWTLAVPDGSAVAITGDVVILGRRPAADPAFPQAQLVAVADVTRTVSKTHARLELSDGTWTIADLGSTNGVVLIDDRGEESEVEPGGTGAVSGRFLLGDAQLRLIRDGA